MADTWWVGEDELDTDQKNVIGLPLTSNLLVTGPPGSGKTNLLLLRANYTYLAGRPNIAVVVFTRTLQDFISTGGHQYAFPSAKVMTSRRFTQLVLQDAGKTFSPPNTFNEQRQYCMNELSSLLSHKTGSYLYDAILIDEAQDYLPGEIDNFRELAGNLFAVADSKQKLYEGGDSVETLRGIVDQEYKLKYHYRCGRKICRLADALGERWPDYQELTPTSHYDEVKRPSSVEKISNLSLPEQMLRIIDKVRIQLQAYPDELIGILSPRQEETDAIWEEVSRTDLAQRATYHADKNQARVDLSKPIFVGTTHSAKGLEFRALHIANAEFLSRFQARQRSLAFTAVTRAKTSLSIYSDSVLPGFFDKALMSLEPLPDLPKLSDVFGRR